MPTPARKVTSMTPGPEDSPDAEPDGTATSPGREPRGNRRREIIQTAFEVFAERGFRGASVDEVAKTAVPELSQAEALRAASLVLAVMDGLQLQWLLDPDEVDMAEAFTLFARLFDHLGAVDPDEA